MNPAASVVWDDVMRGLTGLRLAILDELLRCGALDYGRLAQHMSCPADLEDAVAWLERHRLLVSEDGQWRAVHPKFARVQVEMHGLQSQQAPSPKPRNAEPVGRTPTVTAAVQRHQVEFFTMAGYRDSLGSV